jgi:hypothetical protein
MIDVAGTGPKRAHRAAASGSILSQHPLAVPKTAGLMREPTEHFPKPADTAWTRPTLADVEYGRCRAVDPSLLARGLQFVELSDSHGAVGEAGGDLELAAHGFHEPA